MVNLLWCVVDCLRYDALSLNGYSRETTPNLDELLPKDFVSFENAFTQSSYTVASASSMLTGTYPSAHGALSFTDRLPENLNKFSDYLAIEGIETEAFSGMNFFSEEWGLDTAFSEVHNLDGYKEKRECGQARANEIIKSFKSRLDETEDSFATVLWFFDLHTPWLSDKTFDGEKPNRDHYDSELRFVDGQINRLIEILKDESLYDDTLIVLTSDHGDIFDEHHRLEGTPLADFSVKHSIPKLSGFLQGDGYLGHLSYPLYDELIHVPLYIKLPEQFHGGEAIEGQVELVDLLPTLIHSMGIGVSNDDKHWQGKDLLPLIKRGGEGKEYVFSETKPQPHTGHHKAVRGEEFKLMKLVPTVKRVSALREDPALFITEKFLQERTKLVETGSGESQNLTRAEPGVKKRMECILEEYRSKNQELSRDHESQSVEVSEKVEDELKNLGYI